MSLLPRSAVVLTSLLALAAVPAAAQAGTSPRCTDPEFRQMDFWIGSWEVSTPDGTVVGRSTVAPIMQGCAVREEWDGGQVKGTSINAYDKPDQRWRQMWVDNFGSVLRMEGMWKGDHMELHGSRVGSDGKERELRVTLSPQPDGSLLQRQERSEDGGRTWKVIFEGRYRATQADSASRQ